MWRSYQEKRVAWDDEECLCYVNEKDEDVCVSECFWILIVICGLNSWLVSTWNIITFFNFQKKKEKSHMHVSRAYMVLNHSSIIPNHIIITWKEP